MNGSCWISGDITPPKPSVSARRAASGIARQLSSGIMVSTCIRAPPPAAGRSLSGGELLDLAFADAGAAEHAAYTAHRLAGAVLGLDQRGADVLVAVLAEAEARRARQPTPP